MAYSDSIGDNARLLSRTIRGVTDFSGRSRRTEVIYYWIATALAGVVVDFALSMLMPFESSLILIKALQLLLMVPMFALFVRRLHDQDRSGWWGLLLPLSVLLSIPRLMIEFRGNIEPIIDQKTTPAGVAAALCALAVLALCLWPGTDGASRYGPDPRLEDR